MAKNQKFSNKQQFELEKLKQRGKNQQALKKLQNKGENGYAARKSQAQLQRQKTLRATAYANAVSKAFQAQQSNNNIDTALKQWNTLINGSDKEGDTQTSDTGDTVTNNGGVTYV